MKDDILDLIIQEGKTVDINFKDEGFVENFKIHDYSDRFISGKSLDSTSHFVYLVYNIDVIERMSVY